MQNTVTTIINGKQIDEVNCTPYNEESIVNEKITAFKIPVLVASGVDAGVYIKRESKMNHASFEMNEISDVGIIDLIK